MSTVKQNAPLLFKYGVPIALYLAIIYVLLFAPKELTNYLYAIFLLMPFLDPNWKFWSMKTTNAGEVLANKIILVSILLIVVMLAMDKSRVSYFIPMIIFTALPEEWFFRAYLLKQAGNTLTANIVTSIAFAALHMFTQHYIIAFAVIIPSLFFGLVFQKTNSLLAVVMLHALSNLFFVAYGSAIISNLVN